MWKYILIILFLIFAIREINLMNNSIHLTPDQKKVVVEDETLTSKLILLAKQKTLHDENYKRNIAKEYKLQTQREPEPDRMRNENKTPSEITLETIEENRTKKEIPTLDKFERSVGGEEIAYPENDKTASATNISSATKKSAESKPVFIKPQTSLQNLEVPKLKENRKSKKLKNDLPSSFQSAQERVEAILREMKR